MRAWLLVIFLGLTVPAEAAILYDASSNTTPDEQGWAFFANPLIGAQTTHSANGGVLTLNSRPAASEQAGYFSKIPAIMFVHPDNPTMDLRLHSFSVEFSMRQVEGSDSPDADPLALGQRNRGGFAVVAISEDLTGIELQFQVDNILTLDDANAAFPIGEVQAFDTTKAMRDYELVLSTDGYRLSVDGERLLEGRLRDYSTIAPAPPFDFVYTSPSFFFFGDDTGRGEALTELTRFAVSIFGDCTFDGILNQADLSCVDSIAERDAVLEVLNTLPGDLDGNGDVSFADFLVLSANFNQELPSYSDGNVDLAGGVSFADFLVLSANFGKQPGPLVAVPEPSGSALICLALVAVYAFGGHLPSIHLPFR